MAEADLSKQGGLTGWVASVIESLGEVGVGLLVALENLVPPIPSEIVLSLAGYLASEGRVNVVLVWIAATAGSVIGALALYWLGYALGEERLKRWLDHIPLVDTDDLDTADRWFERHEKGAVLFGRCAPVVRSLVSIPAGANHMNLGLFTLLTAIGSGVWNLIFVGGGYLLGSHCQQLEQYSNYFDYAIYAFFAVAIGSWIVEEGPQTRRAAAETWSTTAARSCGTRSEARADPGELPVRLRDAAAVGDHAAAGAAAVPVDRPEGEPGQAVASWRSPGSGSTSRAWSAPAGRTGRSCRRCPCARTPARRSSRRST